MQERGNVNMPLYVYRAMTQDGQVVRNRVEDTNKHALIKRIKRNGLLPISVTELKGKQNRTKKNKRNVKDIDSMMKNLNSGNILNRQKNKKKNPIEKLNNVLLKTEKITTRDLIIFSQNFYLLKKANFNNIHALNTIIQSTENPKFKEILEDILAGVESGENMYLTMEYYPDVFPYIYINMIKVGELSGSLTNSLQQAVKYLEETSALNRKLRKILIPNIVQFVGLLIMLFVGTLVASPAVQKVFDEVGTKDTLPGVTLWFADVVDVLIQYWYVPFIIIGIIVVIIISYIRTPKGKYNFHYFKYTMPIFGQLIYALDFSRFIKAVLLNIQNGVRIQDALEVSKNVVNNYVMMSIIETSINNILIGQSWIEPFEKAGLSSPMITEMLKIGMQTDLAEMMEKLLQYMDIDIDNIMEKIMKALPEVVYMFVGVVLIFFVIVVLVPVIQVYMGTFLFSAYGY